MGSTCFVCGQVRAPTIIVEDSDAPSGNLRYGFRKRQMRHISVSMEDPPTPSRSHLRIPFEKARQTLQARALCVERYASYLGESRAVEFTAAVACIAIHCKGTILNDLEAGRIAGLTMQQMLLNAFRPILQIIQWFGGDIVSFPSDRPAIFVIWDQTNAEEFIDSCSPSTLVEECLTPHEALFTAIHCLLTIRRLVNLPEQFQSLQTLVTFGDVVLQSPWGLQAPMMLLSGKPIRALSAIIDSALGNTVILHRDAWSLIQEWWVGSPPISDTSQTCDVTALKRQRILGASVWTSVRIPPGTMVEMGQPTNIFIKLSVPQMKQSHLSFPGLGPGDGGVSPRPGIESAPSEATTTGRSNDPSTSMEHHLVEVATLASQKLGPPTDTNNMSSCSLLQHRASICSIALPYVCLSDGDGGVLPQLLRTMCHLVVKEGGKLLGICQWRQYLLLTAIFYKEGLGLKASGNESCLNALRACLSCAREVGSSQPLFTVTTGSIFMMNFLCGKRVVTTMCGRPFNWWLGLVSMPDFGDRVVWCDAETKLRCGSSFQIQPVDTVRKPFCWGLRYTVNAIQELSTVPIQSLREQVEFRSMVCIGRRKELLVIDEHISSVIRASRTEEALVPAVHTFYLWGSSHIGKSTLLSRVQSRWSMFPVFVVRCKEHEQHQPFITIRNLFDTLFAWLKMSTEFPGHMPTHKIQTFIQGFTGGIGAHGSRLLDYVLPTRFREQAAAEEEHPSKEPVLAATDFLAELVSMTCELLQALWNALHCLVICVDDAHFLDAESFLVLSHMHSWATKGRHPYLQILSVNRVFMTQPILADNVGATIHPLDQNEVQEYLDTRLHDYLWEGEHFSSELCQAVSTATAGHPLLLAEVVDMLATSITQVFPVGDSAVTVEPSILQSVVNFPLNQSKKVCNAIAKLYGSMSTDQKKVMKVAAVYLSVQKHCGFCWELLQYMFRPAVLARFKDAFHSLVDGGVFVEQPVAYSLVEGWTAYTFALLPLAGVLARKVPGGETSSICDAMSQELHQMETKLIPKPTTYLCWATLAVHAGRSELARRILKLAEAVCPSDDETMAQLIAEERITLFQSEFAAPAFGRSLSTASVSSLLLPFTPAHGLAGIFQNKATVGSLRRKKILMTTGILEVDGQLKNITSLCSRMWLRGTTSHGDDESPTKLLAQLQHLAALEATVAVDCQEHHDVQVAIQKIRQLFERPQTMTQGEMVEFIWNQLRRLSQQCADMFDERMGHLSKSPSEFAVFWKPEFSVKVVPITQHHQQLLYLLRQTLSLLGNEQTNEADFRAFSGTLLYLSEFLIHMFFLEESIMSLLDYPSLAEHAAAHRLYISKVLDIQAQLQVQSEGVDVQLCDVLYQWHLAHLQVVDRDFGLWVAARFKEMNRDDITRFVTDTQSPSSNRNLRRL